MNVCALAFPFLQASAQHTFTHSPSCIKNTMSFIHPSIHSSIQSTDRATDWERREKHHIHPIVLPVRWLSAYRSAKLPSIAVLQNENSGDWVSRLLLQAEWFNSNCLSKLPLPSRGLPRWKSGFESWLGFWAQVEGNKFQALGSWIAFNKSTRFAKQPR